MRNGIGVVLVGHGSRRQGADQALTKLAKKLRHISGRQIDYAYLQFSAPTIRDTVARLAADQYSHVVLLPVFIYDGQHVVEDIPEVVAELEKEYSLTVSVSEALGPDHRLAEILNERLSAVLTIDDPGTHIAGASLRLIEGAVDLPSDERQRSIATRVVHAAGDRSLGRALAFSDRAIKHGLRALRGGVPIITDVAMVAAGISRRHLGADTKLVVGIDAAPDHAPSGLTRSAAGIRRVLADHKNAIIVIGNAPTALDEVCSQIDSGAIEPALVIGVPVGFVGAVEAKDRLVAEPVEYITLPGTRGGSPIAAAIVNALAKIAKNEAGSPG